MIKILLFYTNKNTKLIVESKLKKEFQITTIKYDKIEKLTQKIEFQYYEIIIFELFSNNNTITKTINIIKSKKTPYIVITENINEKIIIKHLKRGASDSIFISEVFKLPHIINNIINNNKINNELIQCKKRIEDFTDNNPFGVLIYNHNYKWVYANNACEQISEYSANELYRMKIWDKIHHSYINLLKKRAKNRISGEIVLPENIEIKIKTKSGKEKWVYITGKLISYKMKPAGLIFINDISKRKHIEDNYKNIIEFAPIGFYQTNSNGTLLNYNNKFVEILGYQNISELKNKNISEFYNSEFETEKLILENSIKQNSFVKNKEIKLKRKDGSSIWVLLTTKAIKDNFNNTIYYDGFLVEISDKKNAENALNKMFKRDKALLDTIPDLIFILSNDGVFIDYNAPNKNLLFKNPSEFLNKSIKEVFPENISDLALNNIELLNSTDSPVNFEYEIIKDKVYSYECRMVKIDDTQILALIRDITDNKDLKKKFLEKEIIFSKLFYESADPILLFSDNHFYDCNNAATELFGYNKKEEFLPYTPTSLMPVFQPDGSLSSVKIKEIIQKAFKNGYHKFEWMFENKKGKIFYLEIMATLINVDDKAIFYVVLRDITERVKITEELIKSQAKYRAIIENAPDAIVILDIEKNCYIDFNEKACDLYKLSRTDLIKKNPIELSPIFQPDGRRSDEIALEKIKQAIEGKTPCFEWTHINSLNEEIPCEINLTKLPSTKGLLIRGSMLNITDRKKNEEALILAKNKAEESNRLKDAFIANMSHEIRTPLNGIIGMTNILKEVFEAYITEEENRIFNIIDFSSNRLIRTIDMILSISRIQIGEHPVIPSNIYLNELIDNLVEENQIQAKNKGIDLHYLNPSNKIYIIFDKYCITQSLSNLIDNAIKYTNHGYVKVYTHFDNNNNLLICIEDTGIGITEEFKKQIFLPYSQEETGYSRSYEGVGLGLSLVKKLLELNNTEIFVNSEKGNGSTFIIKIESSKIIKNTSNEKE